MWSPIRRQISLLNKKALGLKLRPLTHNHMTHPKTAKKKVWLVASHFNQTVSSWLSGWFLTKLYAEVFLSSFSLSCLPPSLSIHLCQLTQRAGMITLFLTHRWGWERLILWNQSKERKERHTQHCLFLQQTLTTKSCWWSAACSQTVQSPFMDLMMHFVYRNGKGLIACSNLIGWLKIK